MLRTISFAAWGLVALSACAPRLHLGASCESAAACPEPLVCRLGRCRNECVVQRDCPPGVTCVLDPSGRGSCRLATEERCAASSECPAGLACLAGSCANECASEDDCPGGSTCAGAPLRCVRADTIDAGLDAGTDADEDDASTDDAPADAPCIGPGCQPITDVAVSERATCALTGTGAVYCWGLAALAGLPAAPDRCDSDHPCATRPMRLALDGGGPLSDVRSLAGNRDAFCASSPLATWCWGMMGPLGGPGLGEVPRPVRAGAGDAPGGIVSVGVGAALLEAGGAVHGWGEATYGELGDGTSRSSRDAVVVTPPAGLTSRLRLGGWHGCGVGTDGVYCWGENDLGQVGAGMPGLGRIEPAGDPVVGLPPDDPIVAVEPARSSTCALTTSGQIWCWGHVALLPNPLDPSGCTEVALAGGGTTHACPPRPVRRVGGTWARLGTSISETHCAIDDAGAVYCWGLDGNIPRDPLGVEDPQRIAGLPRASRVAVGTHHICAVSSGEVWCWGENELGQLGRGDFTAAGTVDAVPRPVRW